MKVPQALPEEAEAGEAAPRARCLDSKLGNLAVLWTTGRTGGRKKEQRELPSKEARLFHLPGEFTAAALVAVYNRSEASNPGALLVWTPGCLKYRENTVLPLLPPVHTQSRARSPDTGPHMHLQHIGGNFQSS